MCSICFLIAAAAVMAHAGLAFAGFNSWSYEVEDDPFDGKGRLVIINLQSVSSALLIMCEQDSDRYYICQKPGGSG